MNKELTIDDVTWYNRLGRNTQRQLIEFLELPYSGYFDLSAADCRIAREFYEHCQSVCS